MSKILAIDDNKDNLTILKALIQDAFLESVFYPALNGKKGIEMAMEFDPDVILLDIVMPGIDGIRVVKEIRDGQPDARVVVCSGQLCQDCLLYTSPSPRDS